MKSTNMEEWRKKMYKLYPEPKVGDIGIIQRDNIKIYYQALTSEGYNTHWKKVEVAKVRKMSRTTEAPSSSNDYVYMEDGVYMHKTNVWW